MLAGGPGAPARHKSLRALVQWSYDLLSDEERRLLARLSVFRDGFDLAAAERGGRGRAAARGPGDRSACLAGLVERSLVQVHHNGATRYSLLETIRSFATDRLAELGEEATISARHLAWAVDIARAAEAELGGEAWQSASVRLATEQGNLRAALGRALDGPDPSVGCELAARLGRWWFVNGRYTEGRQFLLRALEHAGDEPVAIQARLAVAAGWCTYHLGDADPAEALGARGSRLRRWPPTMPSSPPGPRSSWPGWPGRPATAPGCTSCWPGRRSGRPSPAPRPWPPARRCCSATSPSSPATSPTPAGSGSGPSRSLGRRPVGENLALALICSTGPALVQGDLEAAERFIDEALSIASASGDRFAETIAHSLPGPAPRHPG